jgi:hypothetical protein
MASTYYQPNTDSYPYKHISNLDFQLPKSPAPSDAIALGCAARFNLPPANIPGLMHDRRLQGPSAADQSLSFDCTADPSEKAEMSDSDDDDDDLLSVREIIARSQSIVDLTLASDDDSTDDKNVIEVS